MVMNSQDTSILKSREAEARESGGGDLFQYSRNIPGVTGFLKKSSR
jgi:hypothetical protein